VEKNLKYSDPPTYYFQGVRTPQPTVVYALWSTMTPVTGVRTRDEFAVANLLVGRLMPVDMHRYGSRELCSRY